MTLPGASVTSRLCKGTLTACAVLSICFVSACANTATQPAGGGPSSLTPSSHKSVEVFLPAPGTQSCTVRGLSALGSRDRLSGGSKLPPDLRRFWFSSAKQSFAATVSTDTLPQLGGHFVGQSLPRQVIVIANYGKYEASADLPKPDDGTAAQPGSTAPLPGRPAPQAEETWAVYVFGAQTHEALFGRAVLETQACSST